MLIVIQIVHVIVSITLILFILLQTGKGSDLGAMLGGGGANTLFGATGAASFMSKLTTYAAVVFVMTCLALAFISSHPATAMSEGGTIMTEESDQPGMPPDSDDAPVNTEGSPDSVVDEDPPEAGPSGQEAPVNPDGEANPAPDTGTQNSGGSDEPNADPTE